jgi:hypothetical protein
MPRRSTKKERGVFEKDPGSEIWWIRYYIDGRERREKVGRKKDASDLYKIRKADALRGVKLPNNMKSKGVKFEALGKHALELIDEVYGGRFPGLYLLVTGTPAFYDGPQGIQRLPPLAQRLHVEFGKDSRFDNPRAIQIRLRNFDLESLAEVGRKVRDLVADGSPVEDRIRRLADDAYLRELAHAMVGVFGGKVGLAPRIYLKRLVGDILDRIEQFPDFDPRQHFALTMTNGELTSEEKTASSVDDIQLEL